MGKSKKMKDWDNPEIDNFCDSCGEKFHKNAKLGVDALLDGNGDILCRKCVRSKEEKYSVNVDLNLSFEIEGAKKNSEITELVHTTIDELLRGLQYRIMEIYDENGSIFDSLKD